MEDTLIQLGGDLKQALKMTAILVIISGLLLLFVGTVILLFVVMTRLGWSDWVVMPLVIICVIFGVAYISTKLVKDI